MIFYCLLGDYYEIMVKLFDFFIFNLCLGGLDLDEMEILKNNKEIIFRMLFLIFVIEELLKCFFSIDIDNNNIVKRIV